MIESVRYFKKPESEIDCSSMRCRICETMVDILMFPSCGWECFNMEKAREFRKSISLKCKS